MNTSLAANPAQQQAIEHTEGPVLLIAGPGSGKSFTLVERVLHLVVSGQATPASLLVITFTDKAARELRSRITRRFMDAGLTPSMGEAQVSTFHAMCNRLLTENLSSTTLGSGFWLMDDLEQRHLVYQNLKAFIPIPNAHLVMGDTRKGYWAAAGRLTAWMNRLTEEMVDITRLSTSGFKEMTALSDCHVEYQRLLRQHNALDLAGLQSQLLTLLNTHPHTAQTIRNAISHIMVDEYQDTNPIQERILMSLLGEAGNLCVVGDDDQALYRFRGATVRNLLAFDTLFPGRDVKRIDLTVNHRSHPRIIDFCHWWIENEAWDQEGRSNRYAKDITSRDAVFDDTPTVIRLTGAAAHTDKSGWSTRVVAFLHHMREHGGLTDWNQVAFLFYSLKSKEAKELIWTLEKADIPIHAPRANRFFQRQEVRLVIGALLYLFSSVRPNAEEDTREEPWRYYHDDCLPLLMSALALPEHQACSEWLHEFRLIWMRPHLNLPGGMLGLLYELLRFPLFAQDLAGVSFANWGQESRARNLVKLSELFAKFDRLMEAATPELPRLGPLSYRFFNQFLRFVLSEGLNEYESEDNPTPTGHVSLLTIHQSKGLEFPVVICGSLNTKPRQTEDWLYERLIEESLLPVLPVEPKDCIAAYDFRRLFYTAFSRAQNLLVLSVRTGDFYSPCPAEPFAPFVNALPEWDSPVFEANELGLAQHNAKVKHHEFSLTKDIHLFESCPQKYRLFKELGFVQTDNPNDTMGELLRAVLEQVNEHLRIDGAPPPGSETIQTWLTAHHAKLSTRQKAALDSWALDDVSDRLNEYAHRLQQDRTKVLQVNVPLQRSTNGYTVRTKVDLIQLNDKSHAMCVFRSQPEGKAGTADDALDEHQAQRQIDVFANSAAVHVQQPVLKMQTVSSTVSSELHQKLHIAQPPDRQSASLKSLDQTAQRILRKDFAMDSRPKSLCTHCEMKSHCDGITTGQQASPCF